MPLQLRTIASISHQCNLHVHSSAFCILAASPLRIRSSRISCSRFIIHLQRCGGHRGVGGTMSARMRPGLRQGGLSLFSGLLEKSGEGSIHRMR